MEQIAYCCSLGVEVGHWFEWERQLQEHVYEAEQYLRASRRGRSSLLWTCRQSFEHCSRLVGRVAVADYTKVQMVEQGSGMGWTAELLANMDLQER